MLSTRHLLLVRFRPSKRPAQAKTKDVLAQNSVSKHPTAASREALATNRELVSYGHDRLTVVPESVNVAPLYLSSKAPLPAYKRPSITRMPSDSAQQRESIQTATSTGSAITENLDEFGDDFDLTAEDLDELVSHPPPLDQMPLHQIPQHPDPPPQEDLQNAAQGSLAQHTTNAGCAVHPIQLDDDDGDEFGMDDIDEASFAQAETSATQALRASHPSSCIPNVKSK